LSLSQFLRVLVELQLMQIYHIFIINVFEIKPVICYIIRVSLFIPSDIRFTNHHNHNLKIKKDATEELVGHEHNIKKPSLHAKHEGSVSNLRSSV